MTEALTDRQIAEREVAAIIRAEKKLPDFFAPEGARIVGLIDDREGNTWVFLDHDFKMKWLQSDVSGFVVIPEGRNIKIALRANLATMPHPKAWPGESKEFEAYRDWFKARNMTKPDEWNARGIGVYGCKLPFRPEQITITDQVS